MKDGKACKPCRICGDKAYYNFYGTIACDSCRTFFRRQSLQRNHLICAKRTNNCLINKFTRRVCSRCRMVACLRQGMNPNQVALCESSNPFVPSSGSNNPSPSATGASGLVECYEENKINLTYLDESSRSSSSRPSSALSVNSNYSSPTSPMAVASSLQAISAIDAIAVALPSGLNAQPKGKGERQILASKKSNVNNSHHEENIVPGSSSLVELLRKERKNNLLQVPEPFWKLPPTVNISSEPCDLTGLTNIEKRRMVEIMQMANEIRYLQVHFINLDDRLMDLSGAVQKILFSFIQVVAPKYWALESMSTLGVSDRRRLIRQGLLDLIMIRSIYHFNVRSKTWELTCFATKDAKSGNRYHHPTNTATARSRVIARSANFESKCDREASSPPGLLSSIPSRLVFDEVRSHQCDPRGFFASYFKFIESVTFPGLCHDSICSTLWGIICLFNPHNKGLDSPHTSQAEMTIYTNLLRHYIRQRFPDVDANSAVNFLYNMTSEIITLSQMCAELPLAKSESLGPFDCALVNKLNCS